MSVSKQVRLAPYVTSTPDVLGGIPCVTGTRIPVHTLGTMHGEGGMPIEEIRRGYPQLSEESIACAIAFDAGCQYERRSDAREALRRGVQTAIGTLRESINDLFHDAEATR